MSKKKLPWFQCFPERWLNATRGMTDSQARVYWDFLCLLYMHEEDGNLKATNKWIAYELHVHLNKWLSVRKFLTDAGKIVENPDGSLTNSTAAEVCLERKARSEALGSLAEDREAKRHEYKAQNPRFDFGQPGHKTRLRLVPPIEPKPSPPSSPTPSLGGGETHISLADQQGSDHRRGTHSTSHTKTKEEIEELKWLYPIPAYVIDALVIKVGQLMADTYVNEYYNKGLAERAENIEFAFPGWLKKIKCVDLNLGRGRGKRRETFDIGALAGDELRRLVGGDTKLASPEKLAARTARIAAASK